MHWRLLRVYLLDYVAEMGARVGPDGEPTAGGEPGGLEAGEPGFTLTPPDLDLLSQLPVKGQG